MTKPDKSNLGEKHPDLFVRLSHIVKGMSPREVVRLLKIILELLKTNSISLDFLETLFFTGKTL